jgi:hypothetical protein
LQQFYIETIMDYSSLTVIRPPEIDSSWSFNDHLGALRVRLSLGRNRYRVNPGLYRLGRPGKDSEVFVTSNYKLTFDLLRKNLTGLGAWILVLETYGINVWCAAGKGTFGTDELIRQVNNTRLAGYVSHRRLIVPQLGASGVSAHQVKEATGFTVKFGPVRSEDIKDYLGNGYRKNEISRTVQFNLRDRFILTPVELVNSIGYLLAAIIFFFLLSGIHPGGYSFSAIWKEGPRAGIFLVAAYFSGVLVGPVLLPYLPFRQFGGKGLVAGVIVFALITLFTHPAISSLAIIGWFLLSGAVSSFLTMNFTGASTYTSLSGVKKEMRIFVPIQVVSAIAGLALFLISKLTYHG